MLPTQHRARQNPHHFQTPNPKGWATLAHSNQSEKTGPLPAYFLPVPLRCTACGELGKASERSRAVSATVNVALSATRTDGLNAITYEQLEFAASVPPGCGHVLDDCTGKSFGLAPLNDAETVSGVSK